MAVMTPDRALPRERWGGWRTWEERLDMVARRDAGYSYPAIAATYGFSKQRAHQLVKQTRREIAALQREAERRMERAARGEAELVARRDARLRQIAADQARDYHFRAILREIPPAGSVWPRVDREAFLARLWAVIEARSGPY